MGKVIGGHLSISKGFEALFIEAANVDATAVQIFLSSNRSWDIVDISKAKKEDFLVNKKPNIFVIVHASYLINLASVKEETREKSEHSLLQQLLNCDKLNIPFLVLHPGSFTTSNLDDGIIRIAESLRKIYSTRNIICKVLLENMAGQGSVIGSRFEELARIRKESLVAESIGFCLDTAHLFGSGYNFETKEELNKLLISFDSICGLENLFAVHLNDSQEEFESKKDRHANIGKGKIGLSPLYNFFHHEKLKDKIFILETPWNENGENNYKEEVSLLKKINVDT